MLVLSRLRKESVIVCAGSGGGVLTVVDLHSENGVVLNWHDLGKAFCREYQLGEEWLELPIGEGTFRIKLTKPSGRAASLGFDASRQVRFVRAEAPAEEFSAVA